MFIIYYTIHLVNQGNKRGEREAHISYLKIRFDDYIYQ